MLYTSEFLGSSEIECPISNNCSGIQMSVYIGTVAAIILSLSIGVFVTITVLLIRKKALVENELKSIKDSRQSNESPTYEVIKLQDLQTDVTKIDTKENAAYTCVARICANNM